MSRNSQCRSSKGSYFIFAILYFFSISESGLLGNVDMERELLCSIPDINNISVLILIHVYGVPSTPS